MSLSSLREGLEYTLREEGAQHAIEKTGEVIRRKLGSLSFGSSKPNNSLYDVIFINGCDGISFLM